MQIKLTTAALIGNKNHKKGEALDVEKGRALRLIKQGAAVPADDASDRETATQQGPTETRQQKAARKKAEKNAAKQAADEATETPADAVEQTVADATTDTPQA